MAERVSEIPVVVMGLGEIGRAIARSALQKPDLHVVGAVDVSPQLAGRRLDEVLGVGAPEVTVTSDAARAFAAAPGGVVLHATGSGLERVLPQIEAAVKARLSVVSTCEELAFPKLRYEALADALDELCRENGVAVVGTGVNPGFSLDRLPAFCAGVVGPVRRVLGIRVVDAATRRAALQRKTGAGLSEEGFYEAYDRGDVGHVGLAESAALAALGCGIELDEVEEEVEPVIAERSYDGAVPVRRGGVRGVHQVARGFSDGQERVRLDLTIAIGAESPRDEVEIEAIPPVRVVVPGGIDGDQATAWAIVNAAAPLTRLEGLVTVLDLPAGQ